MTDIPVWLTDEGVDRTMALGREMMTFLQRRADAKAKDCEAKVDPHPELLALLAAIKSEYSVRRTPSQIGH